MNWKETGDGQPYLSFNTSDQDTVFPLLGLPDLVYTKTFQNPYHTANMDVYQVPSVQGEVLEKKIAIDLEFCHCSFSITSSLSDLRQIVSILMNSTSLNIN